MSYCLYIYYIWYKKKISVNIILKITITVIIFKTKNLYNTISPAILMSMSTQLRSIRPSR